MRGAEVFGIGTGNQAKEERRGEERRVAPQKYHG
jgi:hypothetical protein